MGIDIAAGPATPPGGPLRPYTVVVNGVETVLKLNDADAQARGLVADEPAAAEPEPPKQQRRPANKARRPVNKAGA